MSSEIEIEQRLDHMTNGERQSHEASDDERPVDGVNDVGEADEPVEEGGYGWVVVFARFLFGCLEMGTVKSFGIFVPMVIADLHTSTGLVGFAFGLVNGFTYLLGRPNQSYTLPRNSNL